MSILIVDDYLDSRIVLENALRDTGYSGEVQTAESAHDTFEQLGMEDPGSVVTKVDLILMDIDMPEIDGVEACRRIQAITKFQDIPIIMVTSYDEVHYLQEAFAAGAMDYVTKPVNIAELGARVSFALSLKREMDRRKAAYIELEQASMAKTQYLSTVTHELEQATLIFSRYLHPSVVKEMLKNPAASQLGGERAEVTVLFSDIRGFTSLSEWLPPEEVVSLLNHYLTVMSEVVFQHEGTVDKFEGDLIMAFFGAPLPQSNHAERAILTALGMREKLATLQDEWRERTQADLRIGIGIHTGQVFVGNIGSPRKMDYTIIGDTVNTASHLQDLTKEYDTPILVSGQTYSRVKHMAPC